MNKAFLIVSLVLLNAIPVTQCMDNQPPQFNLPPAIPIALPPAIPAPTPGAPAPKTQQEIEEGKKRFYAKKAMLESPAIDLYNFFNLEGFVPKKHQEADQKANAANQEKKKEASND